MTNLYDGILEELSNTSYSIPDNQLIYGTIDTQNKLIDLYKEKNLENPSYYLTKILNDLITGTVSQIDKTDLRDTRFTVLNGLELHRDKITISSDYTELTLKMSPGLLVFDTNLIEIENETQITIDIPYVEVFSLKKYDCLLLVGEYFYLDSQQVVENNYTITKQKPIKFHLFFYDSVNNDVYNNRLVWSPRYFIYRTLQFTVNIRPYLHLYFDSYGYSTIMINGVLHPSRFYNYYRAVWMQRIIEFIGFSPFVDVPYIAPIPRSATYAMSEIFI